MSDFPACTAKHCGDRIAPPEERGACHTAVDVNQGPAQIGRYEILGLLGEGGMGRVYRARDPQLARVVAVKVLPEAFAADEDRLRRFEQEARATAALNHPGIMGMFDVGVHEGAPYLVWELLEGTTLRARLDAGRPPIEKTLDFAIQIADALTVAPGAVADAHELAGGTRRGS